MDNNIIEEDLKNTVTALGETVKNFAGKTILITGGSGFLGKYMVATFSYLNQHVLGEKCRVISLDNHLISENDTPLHSNVGVVYMSQDVKDPNWLFDILKKYNEPIDYILHAAGIASPKYYLKYPLETIAAAVDGTHNMLELARNSGVSSMVYFSSSEIYGDPPAEEIPIKESFRGNVSSTGPRACYDESKRLGETLSTVYYNHFKTPVKIVRPFNVYGPGMRKEDYRAIPTFISKALAKQPLTVYDSGKQSRTFCYISDAVAGIIKVLASNHNGQAFNIGNDQDELSAEQLARLLAKLFGGKVTIKKIKYPSDYPQDEPHRRCPDLTKARSLLDYQPQISVQEGIKRSLIWCRENWN